MENLFWLGVIIAMISYFLKTSDSKNKSIILQRNFIELGNLKGLMRGIILTKVGNPSSITKMPGIGGFMLYQWITPGYQISLIFDDEGKCQGIDHEQTINLDQ